MQVGRMGGCGWIYVQVDLCTGRTDGWRHGQTEGWTEGRMDGWTDRQQMRGQTDCSSGWQHAEIPSFWGALCVCVALLPHVTGVGSSVGWGDTSPGWVLQVGTLRVPPPKPGKSPSLVFPTPGWQRGDKHQKTSTVLGSDLLPYTNSLL